MNFVIAFLWGLSDATFFFFVPYIWLTRLAIIDFKKAVIAAFARRGRGLRASRGGFSLCVAEVYVNGWCWIKAITFLI